jgi:hypothetical protein
MEAVKGSLLAVGIHGHRGAFLLKVIKLVTISAQTLLS